MEGAIYRKRRAVALALTDRLGLPPGSKVLEVGCGAGVTAVALAERGYRVEALDSVGAMVCQTQRLAAASGVADRVAVISGDVHSLPFPEHAFRLVVAIAVLPWVEAIAPSLEEMVRVLQPGGHLIVSIVNRWQLNHVLDPLLNPVFAWVRPGVGDFLRRVGLRGPRKAPRHQTCSIGQFDKLIAKAGLRKLDGCTVGFLPFTLFCRPLFSNARALRIHLKLQELAEHRVPLIRSAGANYMVLTEKQDCP